MGPLGVPMGQGGSIGVPMGLEGLRGSCKDPMGLRASLWGRGDFGKSHRDPHGAGGSVWRLGGVPMGPLGVPMGLGGFTGVPMELGRALWGRGRFLRVPKGSLWGWGGSYGVVGLPMGRGAPHGAGAADGPPTHPRSTR